MNSNLDTKGLDYTVVTATDGKQAEMPAKFAANYTQSMIDSMVMQAHRANPIDLATCAAVGVRAV